MKGFGVPPAANIERHRDETPSRVTMSVDELRQRILNGELKRDDLSLRERELYAEELKKARKF